jgi:hypothetical protein
MFAFLPLCMQCSIVILIPVLGVESCEVGCIAYIFEEHAASIFMVETPSGLICAGSHSGP